MTPHTLAVFATDERYFPLAKGLVLSVLESGPAAKGIGLAMIDMGCGSQSLHWLVERGIAIKGIEESITGPLARIRGAARGLVCRPFLPRTFPGAEAYVWLDADVWVQSPEVLSQFSGWARANPERLFVCPEWHYSYLDVNLKFVQTVLGQTVARYRAAYGDAVAGEMTGLPTYNAGVFAMSAANPLWDAWRTELEAVQARGADPQAIVPIADQLALNVLAYRQRRAVPVDPSFNYLCNCGLPVRDAGGVVRVPLPPSRPIDVIHLANWYQNREMYRQRRLLFQDGAYLSEEERNQLFGGS